jgi:hypothetical protein
MYSPVPSRVGVGAQATTDTSRVPAMTDWATADWKRRVIAMAVLRIYCIEFFIIPNFG